MEYINEPELYENDREFIDTRVININQNDNNNDEINNGPENMYNPASFQAEIIIKYFQDIGILKKIVLCYKCNSMCQMVKNNQFIDGYAWRCRGNGGKHDVKINIRNNSCLEDLHIIFTIFIFFNF